MAKHTEAPSRSSLGTRFFLATVAIVVLAVATAVVLTSLLGNRIAHRAVAEMLERSGAAQETVQEKTLDQLRLVARLFAADPPFAAYVADSIENNDQLSLNDQLEDRRADLSFDLAIVLDPDGAVFARTDDPSPSRDDFSNEPLVVEALNGFEAYGTWISRDRLYYAAAVPVSPGGILEGFLIAGAAIDEGAASELRQISGTDVAFLVHTEDGPVFAASTLDARLDPLRELLRERPELLGADGEPFPVELDRRRYLALARPLAGVTDEQVGSVLSLASLDAELEPFHRIRSTLVYVGLGAILLAVGLSYFLKRRVSQPLERLAAAAQAAAAGDYDQKITAESADEVGLLAESFDSLLSDLREKRDMEIYITELAKSLPEEQETALTELPAWTDLDLTELAATRDLTSPAPAEAPRTETRSTVGPGSRLGERFEILSELGAGGMGVVYKARDASLAELVALKMLKAEVWHDPERLEGLKQELKLARKIAHPNVLRTYDFGELEGVPFISMEYVRGITLRRLLDQSGRLPLSAGLRLARQLCRGLGAAHREGVLHRDIKPENLIVEHTGNVKLMDFGIAQRIERRPRETGQSQVVGTPYYLAPEQLEGREADERADLYATGVVLYELFTGKLPYPAAGNLAQIVNVKMNELPTPPRVYWETMPEDLERILLRLLERKPESRYPSAAALLSELEVLRA